MNNETLERIIARQLADKAQTMLSAHYKGEFEALDGDQTEELSVMFREEMDIINGNK